ncbi:MAG: methyltransferase domain-containing protein [Candidatus Omnitrophica bacterium]|nr:methyltransferase domain-containing protein [Candidatus Omnitrophota bacterium]
MNISLDESHRRFMESWNSMRNGYAGAEYRRFCVTSYKLYQVFVDDNEKEIFDCYQFHAHLQFLRMLSYKDPELDQNHEVLQILKKRDEAVILDFGCGLAQYSRILATRLREEKCDARLVLTDIPTMRKSFLLWVGEKLSVPISFLDCTQSKPIPDLPFCDACIATDVLEHLYEPITYLDAFNHILAPGGLLITDVSDHKREFMHISPNLEKVRSHLSCLGYKEIHTNRLFQKPI